MIKKEVGNIGEAKAATFLKQSGYKIIIRNFRNRLGEIDIIAIDRGTICFVEVRTRQGFAQHANALESVDFRKQQRLSRMAVSFLKEKGIYGRRARFDVVSVSLSDPSDTIILLKDAFPVIDKYR